MAADCDTSDRAAGWGQWLIRARACIAQSSCNETSVLLNFMSKEKFRVALARFVQFSSWVGTGFQFKEFQYS